MQNLRPFVTSQRLYEQLLTSAQPPQELDAHLPFRALCGGLLNARSAYLIPLGPLAPLAGPPLVYPADAPGSPPPAGKLAAHFPSPQSLCISLDPAQNGGASWGVPLWSERGLLGALLLSEKRDGGLYTQEEIEIARSVGERLVDTLAGAEMARRLMDLQRQRLAESQLMDRQARRILHDDVLPRLHAALLDLSAGHAGDPEAVIATLTTVHRQIADLLHDLPRATAPEVARLGLFGALRQVADGELKGAFDRMEWQVTPEAEARARQVSPLAAEVLFYAAREALRNAARHARPADPEAPLQVRFASDAQTELVVYVEDNGAGLGEAGVIRKDEQPATSGQGLILHSTMMAVVGGTLEVVSTPGVSTRLVLSLPLE
jgi:signal transduction histidine kinase